MPERRSRRLLQATNGGVLGAIEKKPETINLDNRTNLPSKVDQKEERDEEMNSMLSPSDLSKHADDRTTPPSNRNKRKTKSQNASKPMPPNFIVAKFPFASPDASTAMSELSADYGIPSSSPVFDRRNTIDHDYGEVRKAIFLDEMSGEDGSNDISTFQNSKDTENSSEKEESDRSCSTEENEFESGEELESESFNESEEDDESEFVVDDDDEEYEIESDEEEDDELEIDSFVDKEVSREKQRKAERLKARKVPNESPDGDDVEIKSRRDNESLEETAESHMPTAPGEVSAKDEETNLSKRRGRSCTGKEGNVGKQKPKHSNKKKVIYDSSDDDEDIKKRNIKDSGSVDEQKTYISQTAQGETAAQEAYATTLKALENIELIALKEDTALKCKVKTSKMKRAIADDSSGVRDDNNKKTPQYGEAFSNQCNSGTQCEATLQEKIKNVSFDEESIFELSNGSCFLETSGSPTGNIDDQILPDATNKNILSQGMITKVVGTESTLDSRSIVPADDEEEIEVVAEILSDDSIENEDDTVIVEVFEDNADHISQPDEEGAVESSFVEDDDKSCVSQEYGEYCDSLRKNQHQEITTLTNDNQNDYCSEESSDGDIDDATKVYPKEECCSIESPDAYDNEGDDEFSIDQDDDAKKVFPKEECCSTGSHDTFDNKDDEEFSFNNGDEGDDEFSVDHDDDATKVFPKEECCSTGSHNTFDNIDDAEFSFNNGDEESKAFPKEERSRAGSLDASSIKGDDELSSDNDDDATKVYPKECCSTGSQDAFTIEGDDELSSDNNDESYRLPSVANPGEDIQGGGRSSGKSEKTAEIVKNINVESKDGLDKKSSIDHHKIGGDDEQSSDNDDDATNVYPKEEYCSTGSQNVFAIEGDDKLSSGNNDEFYQGGGRTPDKCEKTAEILKNIHVESKDCLDKKSFIDHHKIDGAKLVEDYMVLGNGIDDNNIKVGISVEADFKPTNENRESKQSIASIEGELDLAKKQFRIFNLNGDEDVVEASTRSAASSKASETNTATKENESSDDKENIQKSDKNILQRKKTSGKIRREGSIRKGKWSLGSKIGVGSFGVVHVGLNMHSGHLMAIKIIEFSPKIMKEIKMEVELLKSLKHDNIVRYLGAESSSKKLHIFQEWVPGGSVTTLLQKFGPFSTAVMRSYLSQILTGLAYLHANRILHRDIKGGNILVSDNGIVKLADFGAAKRLEHEQSDMMQNLTMKGTPYFMAPEVFLQKYNCKADVWSVGCVAFQMATGQPPWRKEGLGNPISLYSHLQNTEGIPMLEWPVDGPVKEPESKNQFEIMLKRCFDRAALKRPTAQGLLAHSFFTLVSSSDDESSHSRALFSPGDTLSTFTSNAHLHESKTPSKNSKQRVALTPKTPLMSPPLPSKIKMNSSMHISPLHQSPALNANDWPSWARDELQKETLSPSMRSKQNLMNDSLAFSADSNFSNPFARKIGKGTLSSPLAGIKFLDDKSLR